MGKYLLRTLTAVAVLCAAIVLDSRCRIVTQEYEVYSRRLPESFDGFRIVQLSDLHGESFGEDNVRLLTAVREAKPDIIALTGDFVEDASYLPGLDELVTALTEIAPVYFVSGNHDWSSGQIEAMAALFEERGVTYLRNGFERLERNGGSILLAGVEDPNGYADMPPPDGFIAGLREMYPEDYVLLLAHRNYWVLRYPRLDVDTILCGHGHGGIVRLPGIGGIIGSRTDSEMFPKYVDGLYEMDAYNLVVSRGLGNSVPIPRFLNNAHLPVIVLKHLRV